jgi:hypothetical protein
MDMKMETYKHTEEGEIGILVRELVVIRVGWKFYFFKKKIYYSISIKKLIFDSRKKIYISPNQFNSIT